MNVTTKDAVIENTGDDDAFPGTFQVVLSTPAKDRDGDELATEDWKQPLPEHITFDIDHGMSVEKTVGSGRPYIDSQGRLLVDGSYSSLKQAQDTRTLVKEGHIRTVSVAFMTEKVTKDGKTRSVRELLNGAFVAIPSNREAVVLSAKSGARHSAADMLHIQAIADHARALGAAGPMDDTGAEEGAMGGKSLRRMVAAKAMDGSYEQREQAICDALGAAYPGDDVWAYSIATFDDSVVYRVSGGGVQAGQWQAPYTYEDGTVTLGEPKRVNLVEQIVPKAYKPGHDPASLAQGVDAALDEALALLVGVDQSTLPEPVAQALGLLNAAAMAVDELLEVMGVDDPDDGDDDEDAAAGDAAPADAGDAAKTVDAEVLELKNRLTVLNAAVAAAG